MKRVPIVPKNARAAKAVQALDPQPELPVERRKHRIIMNVFGKRFELTHHVEVREIRNEPAQVIEIPRRPA